MPHEPGETPEEQEEKMSDLRQDAWDRRHELMKIEDEDLEDPNAEAREADPSDEMEGQS